MGVDLELYVLLGILILGSSVFAVFEVWATRTGRFIPWLGRLSRTRQATVKAR